MGDFLKDIASIGSSIGSALSPWGSIAAGIGSIGSLFKKDNSSKIAREQMALQRELNQQNIDFQRETNAQQMDMFNQNLAWQRESQGIQNAYNTEQWQRSFDATNEYNSPAAQMQRAVAAGLNPMSVGGASPALAGQNSSPSAGSGAGGSGIPSLTAPQNSMSLQSESALKLQAEQGVSQRFNAIANSLAALSQSNFSSAQTQKTYTMLSAELEKVLNENDVLEQDYLAKEIQNNLDAFFGYTDRDLNKKAATQSISESLARSKMYEQQGEYYMAQKYLSDAKKTLTDWDIKHSSKEYQYLDRYLDLRNKNLDEDLKVKRSQQGVNSSIVSLNKTQEDLNRSMTGYYNTMDDLYQVETKLKKNEFTFNDYILLHRIDRYINECEEQGYLTQWQKENAKIAFEKAQQAAFDTDHQAFAFYAGQVRETLGSVANVIGSVKGLPAAPFNVNSTQPDTRVTTHDEPYVFRDAYGNTHKGNTRQTTTIHRR